MSILSLILSPRCPYCGEVIGGNRTECDRCRDKLSGHSLYRTLEGGISCTAPFFYHGQVREALLGLKYFGRRFNVKSLARCMAPAVRQHYELSQISVVTYVPMFEKQQRQRHYNQAEELARELGKRLHKPCVGLLQKVRSNRVQHELSYEERVLNVEGVYALVRDKPLVPCTVLLVDDICTTGSTLSACSRVLLRGGASRVVCVAAALSHTD